MRVAGRLVPAASIRSARRAREPGFSLLELLVVLVIVGVLASIYTLSFGVGGSDRKMQRQAERLESLIELAAEEAVLHGREIGLHFYQGQYEFSVLDPVTGEWLALEQDDVFKPRPIENDLEIELEIEGRVVDLDDRRDEEKAYEPQVLLLSSGELTPFILRMRPDFTSEGIMLVVDANGETEIQSNEI